MPVTTILQHAIERDMPVTAEAGSDTRMSNDVGNVFPGHIPTESRPQKTPRGSKRKKTATAISSSSSPQTKQPRTAAASRRQREPTLSSTQIASETNHCTVATEEPLSSEALSLGASFFVPLGLSNGMFNGMFNSNIMATYEQSPKGTWEPQLTYYHTMPPSWTNWAVENPFPNAYVAAEEAFNLSNSQSITASPSTSQSNSEQRSSFASSAGQISPASYFTAHSSPMGYKTFPTAFEDSATAVGNDTTTSFLKQFTNDVQIALNEPVADEYAPPAHSLRHFNQQAVTCSRRATLFPTIPSPTAPSRAAPSRALFPSQELLASQALASSRRASSQALVSPQAFVSSTRYSTEYREPSPAVLRSPFKYSQFPGGLHEPDSVPYAQEGARPYGHVANTMNLGNEGAEIFALDYHPAYSTQIQNGDTGFQPPQQTFMPGYSNDYDFWASRNGLESSLFPTTHAQGQKDDERQASNEYRTCIPRPHGAQSPPPQNEQAIERSSPEDEPDIQEGSRDMWEAANQANTRRRMSRTRSMGETRYRDTIRRLDQTAGLESYLAILPVLEPRIKMIIPISLTGPLSLPGLEFLYQVQEPVLVQGRDAKAAEKE
ncbi:hypothetical protein MKX08_003638 [Trichoderma sp. CBMAI-0020]|nr:hypothetical protein MKX08_003638 [Trichoderma sp. CBMAI-0020]